MKRMGFGAFVLATAVAFGCNSADRAGETSAGNTTEGASVGTAGNMDRNQVNDDDKEFVNEMAIAGMAEIELGRLATQKGMNAQVKRFGQMMIDDHTKASEKLKSVVSAHNLMLPTQLDQEHQAQHDRLSKLQGAEFDREYAAAMVAAHQDVSDELESRVDEANLADWKAKFGVGNNTANTAGNNTAKAPAEGSEHGQMAPVMPEKSDNVVTSAINQWAAESYPVVQMHLASARTLNDTLEKSGRNAR